MRPGTAPGAGGVTLDHDRLDLGAIDLTGLSREDILAALTDAALEAFDELGPADFASAAAPLRPVRFTPWAVEFAFDPNEARDEAGKWTAGAGGAGDTSPTPPRRKLVEQGLRIADAHRQNMRALLAKMRSGDYAPEDVEHDVTLYENNALAANDHNFRLRYARFHDRAVTDYGEAAVRSPEWAPIRMTFREVRDKAAEHIQGMATQVRLLARIHGRNAGQPVTYTAGDLRTIAREHTALVRTYADFPYRLGSEVEEFEKTHKPLAGHAGFSADAEFYSPDQPRDDRGRWTAGGGEGATPVTTQAGRSALRQASLAAVRAYVRAGGEPTHVEHEQLAAHLARLTVDQLHAVKVEHGLKASGKVKSDLVARLAERFRLHRAKQESAGRKALAEAVAGREGWHVPRDVMGGHAALHGPTGARVRADSAGTMFDVLAPGSELYSSHATAGEAVRAAEASGRFGTGGTTAEREHAARQEAIAKSRERAAQAKPAGQSAAGLAPEVVAQHQAPYKGASLDNSHAQEQLGFPKALETLRSWPTDKLQAERRDLLRSSYGMFGQNAKKLLTVVEQVIRERQALESVPPAPAAAPPAPAGGGKQPHEMTQAEYVAAHGGLPTPDNLRDHERAVKAAARAGKPIPDPVLKDHPDVAAKLGRVFHAWELTRAQHNSHSMFHPAYPDAHADHRREVLKAVRAGKPVPPEVLAEYPNMSRRAHFDDAVAPLRPVRFVPLVQPPPAAEFAPGGQEDARR